MVNCSFSAFIPLSDLSDPAIPKKYGIKPDTETLDILNEVARQKEVIMISDFSFICLIIMDFKNPGVLSRGNLLTLSLFFYRLSLFSKCIGEIHGRRSWRPLIISLLATSLLGIAGLASSSGINSTHFTLKLFLYFIIC